MYFKKFSLKVMNFLEKHEESNPGKRKSLSVNMQWIHLLSEWVILKKKGYKGKLDVTYEKIKQSGIKRVDII